MNTGIIKKIQAQMGSPKDLNKRQISLVLPSYKIEKLDVIVKAMNDVSSNSMTRNALIEMAIDDLLENAPIAFKDYNIDLDNYDPNKKEEEIFDTVVFPANPDGIDVYLNERKWYYVRMDAEKVKKIKHIAWYISAPYSKIIHY